MHKQGGGTKGKATADHLLILNTIIQNIKNKNKSQDLYIAFLYVTKAYDKAWLEKSQTIIIIGKTPETPFKLG